MATTTLIPFASLPACASSCGPLYDVNGACVPPAASTAAASVYDACFCSDSRLSAFRSTTAGVCDSACTASPAAYNSITSWYNSFCANNGDAAVASTTTSLSGSGKTSSSSKSSGGGGGWISSHWQWVIFIVVMVVGIAGIWIGAAFWRRHYLRTKDRQYSLGKNLARRTGSGQNPYYGSSVGGTHDKSQGSMSSRPGMFMPAAAAGSNMYHGKSSKSKKKWTVTGRT